MIPDVSQALAWLEKHPQALKGIQRGLERETLRVNADGTLATTGHPEALGSALTHKWITTDFAEALKAAHQYRNHHACNNAGKQELTSRLPAISALFSG